MEERKTEHVNFDENLTEEAKIEKLRQWLSEIKIEPERDIVRVLRATDDGLESVFYGVYTGCDDNVFNVRVNMGEIISTPLKELSEIVVISPTLIAVTINVFFNTFH